MKKNKFLLSIAALSLLFSVGLTACGGNGGEDNQSQTQQSSSAPKKETIKVAAADNKTTLAPQDTVQLSASVNNEAVTDVNWASSDATIASVNATGLVTALKSGSVAITASKEGMTEGKINLTIKMPEVLVQIESGTSEGSVVTFKDSHNVDTDMVDAWPQDTILTLTFTATKAGAYELHVFCRAHGGYQNENTENVAEQMEIKVNNADVTLSGQIVGPTFTDYKIGEANLIAGSNTMTVKNLVASDNATTIDYFKFVLKA